MHSEMVRKSNDIKTRFRIGTAALPKTLRFYVIGNVINPAASFALAIDIGIAKFIAKNIKNWMRTSTATYHLG